MLSESGFQAGAIPVAAHSNTTLTSLATLSESIGPEDLSMPEYLRFRIQGFRGATDEFKGQSFPA
jgi:hypothetical protein